MATTAVSKKRFMALEKSKTAASKRAYRYKESLDKQNSVIGATLPVQGGAFAAGALQGMLADANGDVAGIPADLAMGLAGIGLGLVTGSPFLMKAAQGSLAHYTYELGAQMMEG